MRDARYCRSTEVEFRLGDPSKARSKLGWPHQTTCPALVAEIVAADLEQIEREHGRKEHRTLREGE